MSFLVMVSSVVETIPSKDLVVKGEGYTVRLEYTEDYVIVHLRDIDKFTKETFLSMQIMLEDWKPFLKAMGQTHLWAAVDKDNTKVKRLLGGLRFQYAGQQDNLTVYKYEV